MTLSAGILHFRVLNLKDTVYVYAIWKHISPRRYLETYFVQVSFILHDQCSQSSSQRWKIPTTSTDVTLLFQ